MADPEWVRARGRGRRPRDFKCNSDTGPHLPGTLGSVLAIIGYHLFRGHPKRDWSREVTKTDKERGVSHSTPQRTNSVWGALSPICEIEVIFAIPPRDVVRMS